MTKLEQAARQALEALELLHPLTCHNTITALREALKEQTDEPVARLDILTIGPTRSRVVECEANLPDGKYPLYTRPQPAAQWVGLTDEEIDATGHLRSCDKPITLAESFELFARAIEAKLKEKNT